MEIKTARNWYWWLWLSPFFTLITLFVLLFEGMWYDTTTPVEAVAAVLVSGAWHLILIKPAFHKTSSFVRWHGRQMGALAGIRTGLALLIILFSEVFELGYVVGFVLVAVWFFGTLVFQLEAGKGYCSLWRWFGKGDHPLLNAKVVEIPDWKEGEQEGADLAGESQAESLPESLPDLPEKAQASAKGDLQAKVDPPPEKEAPTEKRAAKQGIHPGLWIGLGLGLPLICFICLGGVFWDTFKSISTFEIPATSSTRTATPTVIPNTLTTEQQQRQEAQDIVEGLPTLISNGWIETALLYLEEAQRLNPDVHVPADTWNNLCWYGSLYGYPQEVYYACENALAMWPGHGGYRDSRGLARALMGDYEGAIEDFEALINWADVQNWDPRYTVKRRSWIEDLENGINPFDEETLEELKRE